MVPLSVWLEHYQVTVDVETCDICVDVAGKVVDKGKWKRGGLRRLRRVRSLRAVRHLGSIEGVLIRNNDIIGVTRVHNLDGDGYGSPKQSSHHCQGCCKRAHCGNIRAGLAMSRLMGEQYRVGTRLSQSEHAPSTTLDS